MERPRSVVQITLTENHRRMREHAFKGLLPNFKEREYILVAREGFLRNEKFCLRWRGPRRVVKANNDLIFQVEDLRNGNIEYVHATRLKFYSDASPNPVAILSHVLFSKTRMPVVRLMKLVECENQLKVLVRWKGLSPSDDKLEPIENLHENGPEMLWKLLQGSATPKRLADMAKVSHAL